MAWETVKSLKINGKDATLWLKQEAMEGLKYAASFDRDGCPVEPRSYSAQTTQKAAIENLRNRPSA